MQRCVPDSLLQLKHAAVAYLLLLLLCVADHMMCLHLVHILGDVLYDE